MGGLAKAGVQGLISGNAVGVFFGLEGLDENSVAAMEGDHEVLVTTGGAGLEAACVVSEDA